MTSFRSWLLLWITLVSALAACLNLVAYRDPDRNRFTRFLHGYYRRQIANPSLGLTLFRTPAGLMKFEMIGGAIVAATVVIAWLTGWLR